MTISQDVSWAVELLRQSDRASEHAKRFLEGGKYEDLPYSYYALLNFSDGDVAPRNSPSDRMFKVID